MLFLFPLAVVGLAVAGSAAHERKQRGTAGGQRSLPTAHDYAAGTQVPTFGHRRTREGVECPPLPWLEEDVNAVIHDAIVVKGVRSPRALTLMALHEVYPMTDYGRPLQWPTVPEDCAALKMLEARTIARVRRMLAEWEDLEAEALYGEIA